MFGCITYPKYLICPKLGRSISERPVEEGEVAVIEYIYLSRSNVEAKCHLSITFPRGWHLGVGVLSGPGGLGTGPE